MKGNIVENDLLNKNQNYHFKLIFIAARSLPKWFSNIVPVIFILLFNFLSLVFTKN